MTLPGFQGMRVNADPASNSPAQPRHLDNWRIISGIYVPRPGMTKFNTVALTGAVKSLVDFQVGPKKLYLAMDGCPGVSTSVGTSVNWFDTETQDGFGPGIYDAGATADSIMATFDGRVYFGSGDTLLAFTLIEIPYGGDQLHFSGQGQSEKIWTFTGFTISSLCAFDGKLYIGLDNGAGASKISTWDGLTIIDDTTATLDPPTGMTVWRDQLVVGFSTQDLHLRAKGASPGSYTTAASAGMPTFPQAITTYRDAVYLADGATKVWKYDGASFTSHAIASCQIVSVRSAFGFLYYGYANATNKATLGRLDSAGTYTDVHKDMTLVYAGAKYVRTISLYRKNLFVSLNKPAASAVLATSNGSDTSGTYTTINTSAGDVTMAMVA